MISKFLAGVSIIEAYHEYLSNHTQQLSAMYYMRIISKEEVEEELAKLYGSAIYCSSTNHWVVASHKLSWLIRPPFELFPEAKFVNIAWNGRKVVS